jgi:hypothetical protein
MRVLSSDVPPRVCLVSVKDLDGITHSVTVHGATLYEAAAAAIAIFRQEQWAAAALTSNAVLRIEVQLPAVVHAVPLKAVERWVNGASVSPRDEAAKRQIRDPRTVDRRP